MQIGQIILNIGSITGLIAFFYTVNQVVRKRPRFKFNLHGQGGSFFKKNGVDRYKLETSGIIRNQSLHPNSVNVIHTIVWENKKKHISLRHSVGIDRIKDETNDKEIKLPFLLNGNEAKKIRINYEFPIKGTCDEHIVYKRKDIGGGTIPKYNYDLLFEDTNENVFDANGKLCNMEECSLRWTIGNTIHSMKQGKFSEFIKHFFSMKKTQIKFLFRKIGYYIGLSK